MLNVCKNFIIFYLVFIFSFLYEADNNSLGLPGKKKMDQEVNICEDAFGEDGNGKPVRRFTLTNENRMSVQVINYGATITCVKVPDKRGNVDDVVLGFDDMNGLLNNTYTLMLPTHTDYYKHSSIWE